MGQMDSKSHQNKSKFSDKQETKNNKQLLQSPITPMIPLSWEKTSIFSELIFGLAFGVVIVVIADFAVWVFLWILNGRFSFLPLAMDLF